MNFCRFVLILVVSLPTVSFAQNKFEIPPELKASYEAINQRSVTAAVSFLASDEMKGRDTPSPELTIASAYVAARFKAAGLEGLGDNGSFLQTTEIATSAVPVSGVTLKQNGKAVKHFGLMSAGDAISYQGQVQLVTGDEPRDTTFEGPISIVAEPFTGPRDQFNLMRRIARYRGKGASAILIQVDQNHPLIGSAKRATRPRIVQTRGGIAGAVLLIPKMELTGKFDLELPGQINGQAKVSNTIGVLRGSDPELSKEAIIITAHLDHVGLKGIVGDTICNGADDNATGVTGVVTLADAFGALKTPPKRSVIFMTFWGEEKRFLGAYHYVNNPTWPLEKTVCNINIEMIGRPEPGGFEKAWGTGWDKSDLGPLLNEGSQKAGVLIFSHPQFSGEMLFRSSDNFPFFEKGIVAHSFSAGSLHEDYHQVTDHVEKLEIRHMTRVIQGLFAGSLHLASGEVTPKASAVQR